MANPDPADHQAATQAAARLRDAIAEIEEELGRQPLPEGLLELRPGAPGDGEIRIIFAIEPPGTVLLIAVLEGREAARDQYREAVMLSADVLLEARSGQAAEASARGYDDTQALPRSSIPARPPNSTPARPPCWPGTALARWPSSGPGSVCPRRK